LTDSARLAWLSGGLVADEVAGSQRSPHIHHDAVQLERDFLSQRLRVTSSQLHRSLLALRYVGTTQTAWLVTDGIRERANIQRLRHDNKRPLDVPQYGIW